MDGILREFMADIDNFFSKSKSKKITLYKNDDGIYSIIPLCSSADYDLWNSLRGIDDFLVKNYEKSHLICNKLIKKIAERNSVIKDFIELEEIRSNWLLPMERHKILCKVLFAQSNQRVITNGDVM